MEFGDILQNLKKGIYHPIYLLQGEEPYFIDELSNYIEKNVLTDAEKGFNQTVFYGKDSDALTIAESSMRFPMMASKQVIIVKEAQCLSQIETLLSYAQKPLESTILVLAYKYKSLKLNTKLAKAIKKNGVVFTSKKLYENKIPGWIDTYLKKYNYSITPQAAMLLTAYLGTDLSKIANELGKLVIAVKDSNKITPEHIEKNIGLSKDYNVLELPNALGEKNVLKTNIKSDFYSLFNLLLKQGVVDNDEIAENFLIDCTVGNKQNKYLILKKKVQNRYLIKLLPINNLKNIEQSDVHESLSSLLEIIPVGVLKVSKTGYITYANKWMLEFLDAANQNLNGTHIGRFLIQATLIKL